MAHIIRTRRDTAENWSIENPILALGEQGYETDTNKLKFGDGTTDWNNLPYFRGAFTTEDETKLDSIPTPSSIVIKNDVKDLFKNISYNSANGVLSFTRYNGTIVDVDLPLELIVSSGSYNSTTKSIDLVLANNDKITIPVSDLVNEYYADGTTLELKNVNGKLTFNVKDNVYVKAVANKGLSTNDYTTNEKNKLAGIETNAQKNVIEKIILNGVEQTITDKTVTLNISGGSGTVDPTPPPAPTHSHNYIVTKTTPISDNNKKHHIDTKYTCNGEVGTCDNLTYTTSSDPVNCIFDSGVSVTTGNTKTTTYTCTVCGYSYQTQETIAQATGKKYGVKRSLNSNSSTAWERIEDSVGLVANATKNGSAVTNDFDTIYPWSDIISYNYDTATKTIKANYGDPTFKFDGTNGEVLTKIPTFYYRHYIADGYEYYLISKDNIAGYTKVDQFSVGRYTMSGSSAGIHSKSGVAPLTSTTITNFRNYAKALGSDFGQLDWRYFILQMLYLVEYADYDSQAKLGKGNTNSGSVKNSGGCDTLGMKSGCLGDNYTYSVIYRGIEDIFGNIYQFVDGINIKDYVAYICYDPTKYAVDTFNGDYTPIGYTNANASGSYIKELGFDENNPLITLPKVVGGSSTTYVPDYYYCNSGNRIARVGGFYYYSTEAGLWSWYLHYYSSYANSYLGARLLRYQ